MRALLFDVLHREATADRDIVTSDFLDLASQCGA
jgi:hypothetical protein